MRDVHAPCQPHSSRRPFCRPVCCLMKYFYLLRVQISRGGGAKVSIVLCAHFSNPTVWLLFFKKPLSFDIHQACFPKAVQATHLSCGADLPCCNTPSCDVLVSACEGSPEILGRAPIFVPCAVRGRWGGVVGGRHLLRSWGECCSPQHPRPLPRSPPGGLSPQPSGSWGCFLHANSQGLFRRRGR